MVKKYSYQRNNNENQTTGRGLRQPNYYNAHEMANAHRLETLMMKEVRNGYNETRPHNTTLNVWRHYACCWRSLLRRSKPITRWAYDLFAGWTVFESCEVLRSCWTPEWSITFQDKMRTWFYGMERAIPIYLDCHISIFTKGEKSQGALERNS